jgi:glyoxylase-like metal-dependent hydrolase (beta-lactamase superfamily II)
MGTNTNKVIKEFKDINDGRIITDVLLEVSDTIRNILQVIHTLGHTPGHISLYDRER